VPSVKLVMQLDEDLPEPVARVSSGHLPLPLLKAVSLRDISFSYPGGEKIFDGFSAEIRARTITGVVGQSGRGKTTLIDLVARLQNPAAGRILIDGVLLDDELLPRWKAGLGYLPQDPFFIDGTLRENLVWDSGGEISDTEIMNALEQVNAAHLVKRFRKGLDAFVVNWHTSFSGGECQRLALARVLLRRPSVLLLDEATSSLDAENEATVMDVLARLKERVTIVFVTHRESVTRWFDAVIKI